MARIAEHGSEVTFAPSQILEALRRDEGTLACAMLPEAMLSLIWEGRLVVTGPWRVRLPARDEVKVKPPELVRLEEAREDVIREAKDWLNHGVGQPGDDRLADALKLLEDAEEAVKGNNG